MSQPIFCSCCGAEGQAGCECGAEYISASAFAAKAIARNPEKSNRAIAEEIGVDDKTVGKARAGAEYSAPEKRQGKDGKMYPSKKKSVIRNALPEEFGDHSPKSERRIDTRTGENISKTEALKREAVADFEVKLVEKDATIAECEQKIRTLEYKLSQVPTEDDIRRRDAVARRVHRITTEIKVYNLLRRCLHPDSRNSVSDEILHDAWVAFGKLEPITYDLSKMAPPLPTIDEVWARRQSKSK